MAQNARVAAAEWRDGEKRKKKRERESESDIEGRGKQCFFDRVVWGGLLGVHHTRGIYAGIKERGGRKGITLAASSVRHFYRAHHARVLQQPPNPISQSIVRARQSGAEASQPRLTPIRAQPAGFFFFFYFFPIDLFFFCSLRGAKSKFAYAESTRIGRRGRGGGLLVLSPAAPLIKNFSDPPLVLIIATVRCACR